ARAEASGERRLSADQHDDRRDPALQSRIPDRGGSDRDHERLIRLLAPALSRPLAHKESSPVEKETINPPELFKHPSYSRVITFKGPTKFIFIAGQTPSDEKYQPVHPGNYAKQYEHIMDALSLQLKAAGATWSDVVVRRVFTLDADALMKVLRDP